jgi:hypothetical protein
MKRLTKFLMAFALVANLILLTGCIWPHVTPRCPAISGRVLDAKTHAPIHGAEVGFAQSPIHAVYTDKNGYFHMNATHNFILMGVPPDGVWPDEKSDLLVISHTNYQSIAGGWKGEVGDIFLQPKQ